MLYWLNRHFQEPSRNGGVAFVSPRRKPKKKRKGEKPPLPYTNGRSSADFKRAQYLRKNKYEKGLRRERTRSKYGSIGGRRTGSCGHVFAVGYTSLSHSIKALGVSLSLLRTKQRLFTFLRRIRRCLSISHRPDEAIGVCVGGNLVSGGGVVDCVLFDRRRRVSLALLHHSASLSSSLLGEESRRLFRWLDGAPRRWKTSISLSTAELNEAKDLDGSDEETSTFDYNGNKGHVSWKTLCWKTVCHVRAVEESRTSTPIAGHHMSVGPENSAKTHHNRSLSHAFCHRFYNFGGVHTLILKKKEKLKGRRSEKQIRSVSLVGAHDWMGRNHTHLLTRLHSHRDP
ncbi:LOW QUALITY PROTEIN: hypothetical protein YC2023_009698 [Brassica napus]